MTFKDKNLMWAFMVSNKGVKFEYGGDPLAIWFSIEKTVEERRSSGKVALMARANEVGN